MKWCRNGTSYNTDGLSLPRFPSSVIRTLSFSIMPSSDPQLSLSFPLNVEECTRVTRWCGNVFWSAGFVTLNTGACGLQTRRKWDKETKSPDPAAIIYLSAPGYNPRVCVCVWKFIYTTKRRESVLLFQITVKVLHEMNAHWLTEWSGNYGNIKGYLLHSRPSHASSAALLTNRPHL